MYCGRIPVDFRKFSFVSWKLKSDGKLITVPLGDFTVSHRGRLFFAPLTPCCASDTSRSLLWRDKSSDVDESVSIIVPTEIGIEQARARVCVCVLFVRDDMWVSVLSIQQQCNMYLYYIYVCVCVCVRIDRNIYIYTNIFL